jgi:ketosteroid isomerase-like protein
MESIHNGNSPLIKLYRKISIIFFFIMFGTLLTAQQLSQHDSLKLINVFKVKTTQWKEAYNSKNANNLIPLYSSDSQYISSHVAGLVADGRKKLIDNFQNGMNMGGLIDSVEIIKMEVSCDLATLLCKYQATNSGVTVFGRNLLILKKINNDWFIVLHMTVV